MPLTGQEGSTEYISICIYTYVLFQQFGFFWRSALPEGRRVKKEYRVKSKIGYQDVDIRISEYQVAVLGTPYGGHQRNRGYSVRRDKL